MIELGGYQRDHIPRETRLCPLCKSNQVENESHFLFHCGRYSSQKETFLNRINELIPDITYATNTSYNTTFNTDNYNTLLTLFISYISY